MSELADSVLIQRCKSRDHDAFRVLVERYKRQAYSFAFSYCKNVDDAFAVSQEAFIRSWNAMNRFEEDRSFRAWLFRIVKNLALNLIAKKKRLSEVSIDAAMEESGFDITDTQPDPLEILEEKERKERVWKAIFRLKDEFREIIILSHFNDLSYREIAETLRIPEGTVMSRLYHARLTLKSNLQLEFKKD